MKWIYITDWVQLYNVVLVHKTRVSEQETQEANAVLAVNSLINIILKSKLNCKAEDDSISEKQQNEYFNNSFFWIEQLLYIFIT